MDLSLFPFLLHLTRFILYSNRKQIHRILQYKMSRRHCVILKYGQFKNQQIYAFVWEQNKTKQIITQT